MAKLITPLEGLAGTAKLSSRELDVLELMAEDMSNVEMAATLGVAPRTIETFKRRIYAKLSVKTSGGAVAKAFTNRILRL